MASRGEIVSVAQGRPRVQSAARAIAILLAIAQSDEGLTTREVSERAGIGLQATYHLLHTLTEAGMVARNDGNRHVLGIRVGTLAEAFARQLSPAEHLAPLVRALARSSGETSYAAGWVAGEITVLSTVRGTSAVLASEVPQGHVGDAHARASGKLLLAFASAEMRSLYLERHPLARRTPKTITSRRRLEGELAQVRKQGYATDLEEFEAGLCCLAVPIDRGYSPFVFSISVPAERFEAGFDDYLSTMRQLADRASITNPGELDEPQS